MLRGVVVATEWKKSPDTPFDCVWKIKYHSRQLSRWNITMDEFGWWYLSTRNSVRTEHDIGPFDPLEATAACFEVLAL